MKEIVQNAKSKYNNNIRMKYDGIVNKQKVNSKLGNYNSGGMKQEK